MGKDLKKDICNDVFK